MINAAGVFGALLPSFYQLYPRCQGDAIMKKILPITAMSLLIVLVVTVATVFAASDLTRTYVSRDGKFMFNYPESWVADYDESFEAAVVYTRDVDVYVFAPVTGDKFDLPLATDPVEIVRAITARWSGVTFGEIVALEIGDRAAARVDFVYDKSPGFFLVIALEDGTFGLVEPYGLSGATTITEEDTILAIAETYEVLNSNSAANVQSAIQSLQDTMGGSGDPMLGR